MAYENNNETIADQVEEKQDWAKVHSVFKFPNNNGKRNNIKIEFDSISMADKAVRHGILLFGISIAPYQIDKERYTKINYCMKCYAIKYHSTRQCPKPIRYKACSECSSNSHTWTWCNNEEKKCLNCEGAHRTLAYKCPKRKEAVKQKEEQEKGKRNATYSQAAASASTSTPNHLTMPNNIVSNNQTSKMFLCLIHAHTMNAAQSGCFQQTLLDLLNLNKLPSVVLPNNPPSKEILKQLNPMPSTTPPELSAQDNEAENIDDDHQTTEEESEEEEKLSEVSNDETEATSIPGTNKQAPGNINQETRNINKQVNKCITHPVAPPPASSKTINTRRRQLNKQKRNEQLR